MKVNVLDNKVIVYTYDTIVDDINDYVKRIISKLRKRYRIDIFGFYQIDIYCNKLIGMIMEFIKDSDLDSFYDFLDLKINIYKDSDIFLKFTDYFLDYKRKVFVLGTDYYLNSEDLSEKELFEMIEFCNLVYGDELNSIKKNLVYLT